MIYILPKPFKQIEQKIELNNKWITLRAVWTVLHFVYIVAREFPLFYLNDSFELDNLCLCSVNPYVKFDKFCEYNYTTIQNVNFSNIPKPTNEHSYRKTPFLNGRMQ